MFGLDFNKLGEMVPMIEKFAKDAMAVVVSIQTEQKRQGDLLDKLAAHLKLNEDKE